jgi:hypothetical protein
MQEEKSTTPSREFDHARVLHAKRLTPEQRVLAGFEQSDFAMKIVESGIRHKHPEANDAAILRLLVQRIDKMRQLENLSESE